MHVIHKYPLGETFAGLPREWKLNVAIGHVPIKFDRQGSQLMLWTIEDPKAPKRVTEIILRGTGMEAPVLTHR